LLAGFADDPRAEVLAGRLLEEFHCLLSTVTIHLPPLRERLADLPWLIDGFLGRTAPLYERPITGLSAEAVDVLRSYRWPGNLTELYEVVRGACFHAQGARVELADLPYHLRAAMAPAERTLPLDSLLEQVEARLIRLALRLTRNNKTRAAELLAIWKPRLLRRMEALGIKQEP
jgi:DNA-binding NtrC family response regulator